MKGLRVIRFDQSDAHVFGRAAEVDEWAVSGAFAFVGLEDAALVGKTRQAFANGFLGVPSFGRSTFAVVAELSAQETDQLADALARHFVDHYGAPDLATARPAAEDELAFVRELAEEQPINTVFTVRRRLSDDGIREEFRTVTPPSRPAHARVWDVVDDDA